MVGFTVGSSEAMLWGGELILRDGVVAGQVTSAAWGESTGACVGMCYLRDAGGTTITTEWITDGCYEVDVGGQVFPISVSPKPIYDPTNERVRG